MAKNPEQFPTAFDTYVSFDVIGEGGAGRVFAVKDSHGDELALKCLRPELASGEKRKRFKNEIDFCYRNRHRNLIPVLDSGIVDWDGKGAPFYVMPRYAGTLRGEMVKKISVDNVLSIFAQILDGVEAAHLLDVTHRDLKPENILYDPSRKLFVVADFGIAHFEEEMIATAVETKKAERLLNISYSAPEQRARGVVDSRADIYALGQMLNEMFTGVIPEGAGHMMIATVAPDYAYLDRVVEAMRQQNPASRPQSIAEIKKELIGRRNEFVALQELNAKRTEVVRAAAPETVGPVAIAEAQWSPPGHLRLTLNRNPEPGWVQHFQYPRRSMSYLSNLSPIAYQFQGNKVTVQVEERHVQTAIDQFKNWQPDVTAAFQADVTRAAEESERARRKQLEREVVAAEAQARVNAKLKI